MAASKPQFPGLERIEDSGTREAVQHLWNAVHRLEDREEVSEGLTSAELSQVRSAIQAGGSHQLSLRGLKGEALQSQRTHLRSWAGWYQTTAAGGAGNYRWQAEVANTAGSTFVVPPVPNRVRILKAGTFLLLAPLTTIATGAGVAYMRLYHNTTLVCRAGITFTAISQVYSATLSAVVAVQPGDNVSCDATHQRAGGSTRDSSLYIIRLF